MLKTQEENGAQLNKYTMYNTYVCMHMLLYGVSIVVGYPVSLPPSQLQSRFKPLKAQFNHYHNQHS